MTPEPLAAAAARHWQAHRFLPGQTVAILATGPSLTQAQADAVKRFWTIAISDAWTLAPWADMVYSCDARWWDHHRPAARGLCLGLAPAPAWPRTQVMTPDMDGVLSEDPAVLATGSQGQPAQACSGYQAINLAYLIGAQRILLLGYDMRRGDDGKRHFFGDHPRPLASSTDWRTYVKAFAPLARQLDARGVRVINCTPGSALQCFPKMELEKCL